MNKQQEIISSILFFIIFTGCAHQLTITNADDYYFSTPYIDKLISIGILPCQSQGNERLVNEVVDNLRGLGNMKVVFPYVYSEHNPVDYVLEFNIQTDYSGDGMNFLISFPGFIILAPWWNGYIYNADVNTKVIITDYNTKQIIMTKAYDTRYNCRQSEFDRTWTQGADFFLTYGMASLIGGFLFTEYDNDITPYFVRGYSQSYGSYIARKVGTLLNSL